MHGYVVFHCTVCMDNIHSARNSKRENMLVVVTCDTEKAIFSVGTKSTATGFG